MAAESERTVTGMAKYVEREALIEWLKRIPLIDLSDGLGLCRVIFEDDFKRAIKKIPKGIIVDVAPVRHGRWIIDSVNGKIACSDCGCIYLGYNGRLIPYYCQKKKKKMDGGAE